jgi:hypothetical protein
MFIRREEAERFIEKVRGEAPNSRATYGSKSASSRRAGGRNEASVGVDVDWEASWR